MHTKLTLEISHTAEKDFQQIWESGLEQGIDRASKTIQGIAHKIFSLEYLAYNYSEVPDCELFGIPYRQIMYEKHKVLFQIDKKHVQVLRIL